MSLNSTQSLEISIDSYATFDEILALIPHIDLDNSTSIPRRRQACEIARDVFAEVNGLLGVLGYTVPVVSSNATNIGVVGSLCALGTASRIEAAAASANAGVSAHADYLQREYDRVWNAMRKGDVKLTASREGDFIKHAGEKKPSYEFHQVSGSESARTFTRDMKW